MKTFLHFFGFHFYTKWSKPESGQFVDTGTTYHRQIRHCLICNKYEKRLVY